MNDLDAVAVRILEIAGPGAVAVRARRRIDCHAAALEKRGPRIHIGRRSHNQPEMIEPAPLRGRTACRERSRTMQREVVDARREIDIVGIRLPLDVESQKVDVEPLHGFELADAERQMTQALVGRTLQHFAFYITGRYT